MSSNRSIQPTISPTSAPNLADGNAMLACCQTYHRSHVRPAEPQTPTPLGNHRVIPSDRTRQFVEVSRHPAGRGRGVGGVE
eukprot:671808-Amorphochlora_amoeboformis.AAC.1